MSHKSKIYALCDFELLTKYNFSIQAYIEQIADFHIVYIQYRDKINSHEIQKNNIELLQSLTTIPIIINDNLELLKVADGLHLGQEDLEDLSIKLKLSKEKTIQFIKKINSNKILGLSTHNEKEILEANNLDLDYIGLGAYRATSTKDVSFIVGDKAPYLAKISRHPVGLIGGVKVTDAVENIAFNVIGSDLLKR
jgi:thiamine-phosphate pyrophosphorylase